MKLIYFAQDYSLLLEILIDAPKLKMTFPNVPKFDLSIELIQILDCFPCFK